MKASSTISTLIGHNNSVDSVCLLSDGNVVSGSSDSTLKLWDTITGECLQTLKGHSDAICNVIALQNNKIVSVSMDDLIKIWDIKSGSCILTLSGHSNSVHCVSMIPNGNLVSGSSDQTLKIWELSNGNCTRTLTGHSGTINCVTWLRNGNLVSGSYDKSIKIWDPNTGDCIITLKGHTDSVNCLLLTDDHTLVSGSSDKTIKIWNLKSGACVKTITGHKDSVKCVILLQSGFIVSGSDDNTIKIWNLKSGICIRTYTGHTKFVHCLCVLHTGHIISGSGDNTLKIWDVNSGTNYNIASIQKAVDLVNNIIKNMCDVKSVVSEWEDIAKGVMIHLDTVKWANSLEVGITYISANINLIECVVKTHKMLELEPEDFTKWFIDLCKQIYDKQANPVFAKDIDIVDNVPVLSKLKITPSPLMEEIFHNASKYNIEGLEKDKLNKHLEQFWSIYLEKENIWKEKAMEEDVYAATIYSFCPSLVKQVNKELIEGVNVAEEKISNDWTLFIHHLTRAIMIFSNKNHLVVFRGQKQIPAGIENWKVGDIKLWPEFVCTTASWNVSNAFAKQGVLYKIHLPEGTGGIISQFSMAPNETEVLLPAYSTFSIMNITKGCGDVAWEVELSCLGYQPVFQIQTTQKGLKFKIDKLFDSVWSNPQKFNEYCSSLTITNINTVDDKERTLLYIAARNGHTDIVKWLINNRASVNVVGYHSKSTPLHAASFYRHKDSIVALLKAGARTNLLNKANMTAIEESNDKHAKNIFALFSRKTLNTVEECLLKEMCTLSVTGKKGTKQFLTFCKTCNLGPFIENVDGNKIKCYKGFCDSCKDCHSGHDTYGRHETDTFWCDCHVCN